MRAEALLALLPWLIVTAAAVVVMLAIGLRRDCRLAFYLTAGGLLLALAALPISARLGPMPVTGLLRVDAYALYCSAALLVSALFVALLCLRYFRAAEAQNEEAYVLLLTATLGALLLPASTHFASFFLGLELLSVSLFALIAYRVEHKLALEAGIKYLILSGLASSLLLFGMALVYAQTGILSLAQLGQAQAAPANDAVVLAGFLLMLMALGFKLSLTPLHFWTPDVYQGAPAPITAFLASVSKGAVFAFLLRLWMAAHLERADALLHILALMGAASVLAGNLLALLQANLKRMLAYSSIAHLGYLVIGLVASGVLANELLVETVTVYLAAYMLANLGALGVVSVLSSDAQAQEFEHIADYRGLFQQQPLLAGALAVNLLSLAGIPLTLGFIGKFYVFAVSVDAEMWLLAAIVIIGSGMGVFYYLRVLALLFEQTQAPAADAAKADVAVTAALVLLALLVLGLGLFPQTLMQAMQIAAKSLV
jgi:NADH-quinone oxidoreductase subunit N